MLSYTFRIHGNRDTLTPSHIGSRITACKDRVERLLIFFEEVEEGVNRPHFHGVVKTNYKRSSLRTFIKSLSSVEIKGNSQYSLKSKPIEQQTYPENAYNYVCKGGDNIYNYGYSDKELKDWIREGKDYVKNKNRSNKEIQNLLLEKCKTIKKDENWERHLIELIINIYSDSNKQPPIGYQLKRIIHYILMKTDKKVYIEMIQGDYKYEYPYNFDLYQHNKEDNLEYQI